jgi:hypothetical protein
MVCCGMDVCQDEDEDEDEDEEMIYPESPKETLPMQGCTHDRLRNPKRRQAPRAHQTSVASREALWHRGTTPTLAGITRTGARWLCTSC